MGIYLGLIAYVVVLSLLAKAGIRDRARQETAILFGSMTALCLLLALKDTSVGTDIPGYCRQYELADQMPWQDFDYVYFEKGFLLLMKLFSKAGIPFQAFCAAIYGLLCTAYCRFLRQYSENVTLSVLILICYQFLVFHVSGLRQTLAMAVCIWAFLALDKGAWLRSLCLTALAVSFHTSALIFFAVYPIAALKGQRVSWLGILLALLGAAAFRPLVWGLVDRYLRELDTAGIQVGGNCLFLGLMALFLNYTRAAFPDSSPHTPFFSRMAVAAFAADLMLSGSTLLRGNLFFTLFLIPGIPNAICRYPPRTRLILNVAMGGFLITLFSFQTLAINQLDLLPYRFFWQ